MNHSFTTIHSAFPRVRLATQALALAAVLTATLVLGGVPAVIALKISAYLFFLVMPLGAWLVARFLSLHHGVLARAGLGTLVGALIHPLTVLPFFVAGAVTIHVWVLALFALAAWWRLGLSNPAAGAHRGDAVAFLAIAGGAGAMALICYLAISNDPSVISHYRVQAIGMRVLADGWPPQNPYIAGLPYRDNFGVHLSGLAMATGAAIPIPDLGTFPIQLAYLWLAIFAVGIVGKLWLGLSTFGALAAMMASYFILGLAPINTSYFGSAQPTAASMTLSPLLGHVGFLVSLFFFAHVAEDEQAPLSPANLSAIVVLAAATMLARANAGALLGVAVAAHWLARVVAAPGWQPRLALYVSGVAAGTIAAMVFSLGSPFGGSFSGTGFLKLSPTATLEYLSLSGYPIARLVQSAGFSAVTAGAFAFAVFSVMNASFLAPVLWWRAGSIMRKGGTSSERLLLLAIVAGLVTTLFTFAEGGSNFVFLQLGKLAMCLLGAAGLDHLLRLWREGAPRAPHVFLGALVIGLAAVHLYDADQQRRRLHPGSRLLKPPPFAAAIGRAFDVSPILERIPQPHRARFVIVHRDKAHVWTISGRASDTILHHGVRLVVHDVVDRAVRFSRNESTPRLEILSAHFARLNAAAARGVADLSCAVALADASFARDADIYVLSQMELAVLPHPRATRMGETDELIAWRIAPATAAASAPPARCD